MLKCEDCGNKFEEPVIVDESQTHEYWGGFFKEELFSLQCPRCGSEYIDDFTEEEEEEEE